MQDSDAVKPEEDISKYPIATERTRVWDVHLSLLFCMLGIVATVCANSQGIGRGKTMACQQCRRTVEETITV